jgi:hypothetical protein
MRQMIRAAVLATAAIPVLLFATPVHAQTLAGAWESSVATRVSNEGGVETPSAFVPVAIRIDQKGDSLFATWQRGAAEGMPAGATRNLKGSIKDGVITLVSEPAESRINRNGEESIIKMVMTLSLKVQNDELVGTMTNAATDGSMDAMSREFKATRKKA